MFILFTHIYTGTYIRVVDQKMGNDRDGRDASLIVPARRAVPTRRVRRDGGEDGGERFRGGSLLGGGGSFVRSEDVRRGSSSSSFHSLSRIYYSIKRRKSIEETFVHHADAVFEHGGHRGGVLRETVLERTVGARFGVFPARTAELYHC